MPKLTRHSCRGWDVMPLASSTTGNTACMYPTRKVVRLSLPGLRPGVHSTPTEVETASPQRAEPSIKWPKSWFASPQACCLWSKNMPTRLPRPPSHCSPPPSVQACGTPPVRVACSKAEVSMPCTAPFRIKVDSTSLVKAVLRLRVGLQVAPKRRVQLPRNCLNSSYFARMTWKASAPSTQPVARWRDETTFRTSRKVMF